MTTSGADNNQLEVELTELTVIFFDNLEWKMQSSEEVAQKASISGNCDDNWTWLDMPAENMLALQEIEPEPTMEDLRTTRQLFSEHEAD